MKKTQLLLCLAAGALLITASNASAQAPAAEKFFVNVNVGGQLASRTFTSNVVKTVYDEPATLTATQKIGKSAVIDFGGGYRVWEDVYVGLTISRYGTSQGAAWAATIPHPLVTDAFAARSGVADDLGRTEVGVDPYVLWVTPLLDNVDVSAALGLSIIHLSQDVLGDMDVPQPTQDVTPLVTSESGTGTGVYAALDFIYRLTPRYGVGGFLRYAGASVDLPSSDDTTVGGFQLGAGLRVRF
jgi:hypothetical protein